MAYSEDNFSSIPILVRVAECKSFTEAAFKLRMSASGVSRAISRMEKRLGVSLVKRTTRGLSLTEEGVIYVERCRLILSALEDADARITDLRSTPSGVLHVQMPPAYARKAVVPALPQFLERNPGLQIELELSGRTPDLAEEPVDVVLSFGHPRDSYIVARKLRDVRSVICASPAYLERHGRPQSLEDLARHRCLSFVNPRTGRHDQWVFAEQGHTRSVSVHNVLSSNDVQSLVDSAVAGIGIINVADVNVADEITTDKLVPILTQHQPAPYPLYLLYLPNRNLTRRVRCFIDFIVALLHANTPAFSLVDSGLLDAKDLPVAAGRPHEQASG